MARNQVTIAQVEYGDISRSDALQAVIQVVTLYRQNASEEIPVKDFQYGSVQPTNANRNDGVGDSDVENEEVR